MNRICLSGSWVEACPESFRGDILRRLNNPPGVPGSEPVYDYGSLDAVDLGFLTATEEEIGRPLTKEERKMRRKYAQAWGVYSEALVCCWLLEKGYPILEKDWSPIVDGRPVEGEIDIITQKGDRMVFVEVKARCGKHSDPWEAIDSKKRMKLCRGADFFLKMQRLPFEYQFDVALLTGDYLDYEFEYIEDAFLAPLRTSR